MTQITDNVLHVLVTRLQTMKCPI